MIGRCMMQAILPEFIDYPPHLHALLHYLYGYLAMLRANLAEPVPPALVAFNVTLYVPPDPLGVPEMRPLVVLTESPGGKPVALKLVGLLVAVIW